MFTFIVYSVFRYFAYLETSVGLFFFFLKNSFLVCPSPTFKNVFSIKGRNYQELHSVKCKTLVVLKKTIIYKVLNF